MNDFSHAPAMAGLSYAMLRALPARPMAMGFALSWQAARDPDRAALTIGDATLSRMDLDRRCNRMARAFAEIGIARDDRIVVVLPTGPQHQIVAQAGWKLGACVIPLSPKLVDGELTKLIEQADPALVIGIDPARLPDRKVLPADFQPAPELDDGPLPEAIATRWKGITSGGSTGMPKLMWDNFNSVIDPLKPLELFRMIPEDRILHPAGAYHNAPFSQTNWALDWGCHVVLMERFDPVEWLKTVERHQIRWAYLVPTMMSRILSVPVEARAAFDVSSLEVVMHMAAPCPRWVKAEWIAWLGPEKILEVYAGSEGYGSTLLTGQEWLDHPGTVGKAPPNTQIRDEAGDILPPGEIGTIYFLPPAGNIMGLPEEYRTFGDLGWLDEDFYLYIADRRTDMIVCGGVNLYPAEIEAAVEQFPGVVAAVVVGLPHADLGSVPHAILELAPESERPDPAVLSTFLRSRLARTKFPRSFEVAGAPIRDEAGKMRRSRWRSECLARAGADHQRLP